MDPFTTLNGYHTQVSLQTEERTRRVSLVEREIQFTTPTGLSNEMSLNRRRHSLPMGNSLLSNSLFGIPRMGKNQVLPALKPIGHEDETEIREVHTLWWLINSNMPGSREGGQGSGPLKNHKNLGVLLEILVQHSMLGHHQPASKTPFTLRFAGGPIMTRF